MRFGGWIMLSLAAMPTAAAAQANASSDGLVRRAKAGDAALDYTALRAAHPASGHCDPYGDASGAAFDAEWTAFRAGDCTQALAKSDAFEQIDFLYFTDHVLRAECHDKAGDTARTETGKNIARGLMRSLQASGDGKSLQSAWRVVMMREEKLLPHSQGLAEKGQALLRVPVMPGAAEGPVRMVDRSDAVSKTTGATRAVYFDVSALFTPGVHPAP